jgi:hypothetical protein
VRTRIRKHFGSVSRVCDYYWHLLRLRRWQRVSGRGSAARSVYVQRRLCVHIDNIEWMYRSGRDVHALPRGENVCRRCRSTNNDFVPCALRRNRLHLGRQQCALLDNRASVALELSYLLCVWERCTW